MKHPDSSVLPDLVDQLGRQRQLVEYLLFKLVEAHLLLTSEEAVFVPIALNEIEGVLERLRDEESAREQLISRLAREWRVRKDDLTLTYLTERSPEPYHSAFAEHRTEFMSLVDEVERVTRENRRLASAGLTRVQAALSGLVEDASTYSAAGRVERALSRPVSHDEVV